MLKEKHVVIVGTGASGMLTAIQVARQSKEKLTLSMVEKEPGVRGGGLTFGMDTSGDEHRINIKTKYLSAFPDKPNDFLDWLQTADRSHWPEAHRDLVFDERAGVPRKLYGIYLTERLQELATLSEGRITVNKVDGQAVSVDESPECVSVRLHNGREIQGTHAVLATGYLAPRQAPFMTDALRQDTRFVFDQWTPQSRERIHGFGKDANVLVLGTGLSAYDVIVSLRSQGHTGKITLMSRNGNTYPYNADEWNAPKLDPIPKPPFVEEATDRTSLIAGITRDFNALREKGYTAKQIINSWERYTPEVAANLGDPALVASLLNEYGSLIASQRISVNEDIQKIVDAAERDGKIEFVTGNIHSIVPMKDGLWANFTPSGQNDPDARKFDYVVNAIGQEVDVNKANDPLWDNLMDKEAVAPHFTNLGVRCDDTGRPLDTAGNPAHRIYMVGIMRAGESTVTGRGVGVGAVNIPTIKDQAGEIAEHILSRVIGLHTARAASEGDVPWRNVACR